MEMNFCRRCGAEFATSNQHVYTCKNGHTLYLNAAPTAGIIILSPDNSTILMTIRGVEPFKGMLDSVGGFVDGGGETVEQAAMREMKEETGLDPHQYEPLVYITSGTTPYPYGDEVISVLTMMFYTRLIGDAKPVPQDDVAAFREVPLHEVNLDDIGGTDVRAGVIGLQALFPKEES